MSINYNNHSKIYIPTQPKLILVTHMKDKYIRIMVTQEQKNFIQKIARDEMRTMTAIINKCLREKYPEYPVE